MNYWIYLNIRFRACKYAQMKAKKVDKNAFAVASARFGIVIFGNVSLIKSRNSSDHKSVVIPIVVLYYGSQYYLLYY